MQNFILSGKKTNFIKDIENPLPLHCRYAAVIAVKNLEKSGLFIIVKSAKALKHRYLTLVKITKNISDTTHNPKAVGSDPGF